MEDHDWGNSDFPPVVNKSVREQLYQIKISKSLGPEQMHLRVLKELVDAIARHLSAIYQSSWKSVEVPANWKLANIISMYEKDMREDKETIELLV